MQTLMQSVVSSGTFSSIVPWLVLIAVAYFGYKVFIEKDEKWIETLTTSSILVPTFFLVALNLVPSTVMSLFGIIEPVMTIVLQLFSGILLALVVIAIPTYLLRKFEIL